MEIELTIEEWLQSTQTKRDELQSYSKSALPQSLGERMVDLEKAIQCASDVSNLLSDAEVFLTHEKSKALYRALDNESLSSADRAIVIKDEVRLIQRLVDGLKTTKKSIQDRIYANLNANRAGG